MQEEGHRMTLHTSLTCMGTSSPNSSHPNVHSLNASVEQEAGVLGGSDYTKIGNLMCKVSGCWAK